MVVIKRVDCMGPVPGHCLYFCISPVKGVSVLTLQLLSLLLSLPTFGSIVSLCLH